MRRQLRIGMLGSGYMGRTYTQCIEHHNTRNKVVAVAGGTRAPGLAAEYGVAFEPTFSSLLSRADVDAVLIATPHAEHVDQVQEAAIAGKHVLVEKPMATSVKDCVAMIKTCCQSGVSLEVIQTLRFRGTFSRAKKIIDEGMIGQVRMLQGQSLATGYFSDDKPWTGLPLHGGAFLDMGVHNFDALRFLSGSDASRIFCHLTTYGESDHSGLSDMAQIVFESGAVAQQWMSYEVPSPNYPSSLHRYKVVGEIGSIDIDGYGKLLWGKENSWEEVWKQPKIDYINRPMESSRLEAFYLQTQAFTDNVLDGNAPTVSGEDGLAAVEMVEGARISARTGQAIDLPLASRCSV